MNKVNSEITAKLALEFSKVLRSWLTPKQMAEVVKRNREETEKGVCNSGTFCDSNMAMDEAMRNLNLTLWNLNMSMNEEAINLWNDAWNLAIKNEFKV